MATRCHIEKGTARAHVENYTHKKNFTFFRSSCLSRFFIHVVCMKILCDVIGAATRNCVIVRVWFFFRKIHRCDMCDGWVHALWLIATTTNSIIINIYMESNKKHQRIFLLNNTNCNVAEHKCIRSRMFFKYTSIMLKKKNINV